jgi:hypothetical protein
MIDDRIAELPWNYTPGGKGKSSSIMKLTSQKWLNP